MDREKGLRNTVLSLCLAVSSVMFHGCERQMEPSSTAISIILRDKVMTTRACLPDEDKISTADILVFDSYGKLDRSIHLEDGESTTSLQLLAGERYTFITLVNFGNRIKVQTLEDMEALEFHLAYPDEYREGIPMYGIRRDYMVRQGDRIEIGLTRMMSKISIAMDRSRLSEGIQMNVSEVRIGNCPKRMTVFENSRVDHEDDCFSVGFSHKDAECAALNKEGTGRISDEISLYMLENMQGAFSEAGPAADEDKVFDEHDIRSRTCSFVEIKMEYSSSSWTSREKPLIYRFYLGDGLNSLNIERNCHYHIRICPEDDGLHGDGWRVDKSGLSYTGLTELIQFPSDYISGKIGDVIHIGCRLTPSDTPFDVGIEYMEEDRAEGIYDYVVDPDGKGAVLTLTGPGQGLIYMQAGEPVNDAALFIIEVNRP